MIKEGEVNYCCKTHQQQLNKNSRTGRTPLCELGDLHPQPWWVYSKALKLLHSSTLARPHGAPLQTGLSRDGGDTVDVSKRLSTSGG